MRGRFTKKPDPMSHPRINELFHVIPVSRTGFIKFPQRILHCSYIVNKVIADVLKRNTWIIAVMSAIYQLDL